MFAQEVKMSDASQYDICPFENQHRILKHRMAPHISRCKNNHPEFQQCPFNSNHFSKNMKEHLAMCPQKNDIAQMMGRQQPVGTGMVPTKETCNIQCDEEWSDDEPTYDPTVKLATSDVIRVDKKLMPKAQRKAFAEEERLRLNKIRNNK